MSIEAILDIMQRNEKCWKNNIIIIQFTHQMSTFGNNDSPIEDRGDRSVSKNATRAKFVFFSSPLFLSFRDTYTHTRTHTRIISNRRDRAITKRMNI